MLNKLTRDFFSDSKEGIIEEAKSDHEEASDKHDDESIDLSKISRGGTKTNTAKVSARSNE